MVDIYSKISELRESGNDLIIVTVTEKDGQGPADVGKKMIVSEDGQFFGTIGGGAIEYYAIEKSKKLIKERKSLTEKYILNDKEVKVTDEVKLNMACGGSASLFYEFIGPKQYVYIFGAGHCGKALANLLKPLGFYITIIDDREELLNQIDSANKKVLSSFSTFVLDKKLKENAYIVVCTPSHKYDYAVLDAIFETNYSPAYFGMLCSKKKIADYLEMAKKKYDDLKLDNFYSPIGLNIGGDSPEEIAVSISAEILSVYYNKSEKNAHMKNK